LKYQVAVGDAYVVHTEAGQDDFLSERLHVGRGPGGEKVFNLGKLIAGAEFVPLCFPVLSNVLRNEESKVRAE